MPTPSSTLLDLLHPAHLTAVIDIGANPIEGEPPYKRMLQDRLCRLTGFEPQSDALAALNARKSDLETYLPYAVGDGQDHVLKICKASGMTSLLEPDPHTLKHFPGFPEWGTVVRELPIKTHRLDDIAEIDALDFLKIDVQGSELSVFQNGRSKLAQAVAIQTEVSFLPLYKQQPVLGDIDRELRALGFVLHGFAGIDKRMIAPMTGSSPHAALNQLLEADMVYVRDFRKPDAMDGEQLKHLAMIAHHCYGSYDLSANCIFHLSRRGEIPVGVPARYMDLVKSLKN